MMNKLERDNERLRDILESIVATLEPLGAKCPNCCEGCQWEMQDALTEAMNGLAGLESHATWKEVEEGEFPTPGQPPLTRKRDYAEFIGPIHEAWRKAGFCQDKKGYWRSDWTNFEKVDTPPPSE